MELTQQDREDFWRTYADWSPSLPRTLREAIEREFSDTAIQIALLHGF